MNAENNEMLPAPKPKPELNGIGGWLILPLLGVIFSALFMPFRLWHHNQEVIEYWSELTSPGSDYFIPLFKEVIYFETVGNAIIYGTVLYLCYLFFTKKKLIIKVYAFFQIFSLAVMVFDLVLANQLLDLEIDSNDIRELIRGLFGCFVWVPYFFVSVRVRNTFIN
ncbi:DUF2569 family protein [Providencia sp. wls1943]|jgi:hypothetical protein|uniref:DUF2569 domain-containing protein n=1 Tax=Providencia zhijiangensis TaxID=3053982 RepID=A0ABZ0N1V4_9GAMM|nr:MULTISPECIES: DUF2569 domain-containing protein [Providencia]MTB65471.1 DUF2569 family protein [Providencia sp. wls1943]MTC74591.1 DUF2569 family protein [Providencia sp. wls1919]QLR05049.1 DUF2569 domain-containing protein [Providencia rettgeri]WPA92363.1 DUF2569 domain-containing protein [Providencia sp. D4759]